MLSFAVPAWAADVDYLRDIKPLLAKHCVECHGPKMQKAKLRVDTAAFLRKGGSGGPVIVAGKSADSSLVHVLRGTNEATLMPFKRPPLASEQIKLVAAWIDQGAKAPAREQAADASGRDHWAFKSPLRHPLPQVKDGSWVRNPIDRFVLARLEKEDFRPSPEADRLTLLRRVYLDLLGLPPSVAEVNDFMADTRPDAYERMVERVLDSPHYGERWGRHWLDVARYADSNGFTIDAPREIWKYRDWVIDALNRDMPFDQFVIEQFAGDMLPNATLEQKTATGFHRNTLINQEGGIDEEQFRVEAVSDRIATTGIVFLGLTLGCARCHDHKYDPVSQKEFFRLFAFMNNQSEPVLPIADPKTAAKRNEIRTELRKLEEELDAKYKAYVQKLPDVEKKKVPGEILMILSLGLEQRNAKHNQTAVAFFKTRDNTVQKTADRIAFLRKAEPKFPTTMVLQELPKPRVTNIHISGDFTRKGEKVDPGVPSVLHALPIKSEPNRLDLARWLVDRKNPLIGRVTMNRLWMQYFGKGLVETENDFGLQSAPPSHPELLDWLAVEFMDRWSLKAMHRLIVNSATYRQSSRARPELAVVDPFNRLLARQSRLRLDAEIVRDNALAVSDFLSRRVGGPSVYPPQPGGIYQFTQLQHPWKTSTGPERYRRGVYTFFQRSAPYPALTVFDAPDGNSSCTRRIRSNTPLQALTLLNDQVFVDLSQGVAQRIIKEAPGNDVERLQYAYRLCLARAPSPQECRRLEQYLAQQREDFRAAPKDATALLNRPELANTPLAHEMAAWTSVARVLLNLDEFITRE